MEVSEGSRRRRFASLLALAENAAKTFQRFPLTLLSAVAAAVVAHHLAEIEFETARGADAFYPFLMAAILGIPLFFSLTILGESRDWSRRLRLAAAMAGLAALTAYYLALPHPIRGADITRYLLLIAALHLLASFVPFLGRPGAENGFWQYNKALSLRFVAGALYSAVLFIGLSLAIAACETLLDLDFEEEIYLQLWFWVAFAYNTWFFLAGSPKDIRALESSRDYPAGIRIFTQYVLIPLVVVYLIILYAYLGKIIIEWELPKGWVGYPVIGVSVTGMLALLLVHPVRERVENRWIVTYARWFYWALYPLIGLIAVAIWTRISAYGITERRYLVVVATAWILGIALYFTFRRRRDIRIIPITLCLVTGLTTFGPWGATAVSRGSQLRRLQALLVREEVMAEGVLRRAPKTIEFEREKEISNIVKYLHDTHGLGRIRAWYAEPERLPEELTPELAMEGMGLKYIRPWEEPREGFAVDADVPNPLPLAGFDYVYEVSHDPGEEATGFRVAIDSQTELSLAGTSLLLGHPDDPATRLRADLGPLLIELRDRDARGEEYGPAESSLDVENASIRLLMYLRNASGKEIGDSIALSHLSATVLIRRK